MFVAKNWGIDMLNLFELLVYIILNYLFIFACSR